jgi:hypothetical protein
MSAFRSDAVQDLFLGKVILDKSAPDTFFFTHRIVVGILTIRRIAGTRWVPATSEKKESTVQGRDTVGAIRE